MQPPWLAIVAMKFEAIVVTSSLLGQYQAANNFEVCDCMSITADGYRRRASGPMIVN
jgi:hypothetical protein